MLHFPSQSQSLIRLNLCASQRCQNSIERRWMNTKWYKMILYIYIHTCTWCLWIYIYIYLYFYILYLWLHRLTYIICKNQRRHSMWPVAHVAGLVSETQWSKCAEARGEYFGVLHDSKFEVPKISEKWESLVATVWPLKPVRLLVHIEKRIIDHCATVINH